jgi:hypothetical protein
MLEEILEAALEADAGLDLLHLGADPGDFAQAELVDRLGLERQRGVDRDQPAVEPVAAPHVHEPGAFASAR